MTQAIQGYSCTNEGWSPTGNIYDQKTTGDDQKTTTDEKTAGCRIATLNILSDTFPWFIRMAIRSEERVSALLRAIEVLDADILALNEVSARGLEVLLGSAFIRRTYHVSESPDRANGSFKVHGCLLLSKFPFRKLALVRYQRHRPAVAGLVDVPGALSPLVVCSLHTLAQQTQVNAAVRCRQIADAKNASQALCPEAGLVVLGDLNMHEVSEDAVLVRENMLDLWVETHNEPTNPSGSSSSNNSRNSTFEGFTFDPVKNSMISRYIPNESRRMRLDRILLTAGSLWAPSSCVSLWADQPLDEELFLSDHFGLWVELSPSATPAQPSPRALAILTHNASQPFQDHSVRNLRFALACAQHAWWLGGRVGWSGVEWVGSMWTGGPLWPWSAPRDHSGDSNPPQDLAVESSTMDA